MIVCKKAELNEYGQFMEFEPLTMVPIDLEALDPSLMTERDKTLLNDYHKKVYNAVSPYLTEEEVLWLKEQTRAI
jgi:Xaa-Pro aminopeptidase